jgi:hypothetical protein
MQVIRQCPLSSSMNKLFKDIHGARIEYVYVTVKQFPPTGTIPPGANSPQHSFL